MGGDICCVVFWNEFIEDLIRILVSNERERESERREREREYLKVFDFLYFIYYKIEYNIYIICSMFFFYFSGVVMVDVKLDFLEFC